MGFPTKNDHFGVFWGYLYFWKPPYIDVLKKWVPFYSHGFGGGFRQIFLFCIFSPNLGEDEPWVTSHQTQGMTGGWYDWERVDFPSIPSEQEQKRGRFVFS